MLVWIQKKGKFSLCRNFAFKLHKNIRLLITFTESNQRQTTMKLYLLLGAWISVLGLCCVVEGCNQRLCASIVSRCQLINACQCDMTDKKNCTCCHNCQLCLAQLYSECCSCVGKLHVVFN